MRMRTTVILAALLRHGPLGGAGAGQARLRQAGRHRRRRSCTWRRTSGKQPRRLGIGRAPTISPNGQWVAFVTVPTGGSGMDTVVLQRLDGRLAAPRHALASRSTRCASRPTRRKIAAIAGSKRVRVYDMAADELHVAAEGDIRGYSFAPDGKSIVVRPRGGRGLPGGRATSTSRPRWAAELSRLTELENALNPVWGPKEIVFDRFKRRKGDAPAYNLWALTRSSTDSLRRLTNLTIPPLVSGLVPLEVSADSRRLLTVFTGQDTEVGLHGADAHRQVARALDGLRARPRRLRPLRGREDDPRAHRRPGPGRTSTTW